MRHNAVSTQLTPEPNKDLQIAGLLRRWFFLLGFVALIFATLACGFLEFNSPSNPEQVTIRKHLPTLTPTPLPPVSPSLTPSFDQVRPAATEPVVIPSTFTPVPAVSTSPVSGEPLLTALVVLNVRAGPGLDYPIVGQLAPGQSARITGKNPDGAWWQIIYPLDSNSLAWVSADVQYATVSHTEAVPIAQLPATPAGQTPTPIGLPNNPPSTLTPTLVSGPGGWAFAGVRLYPDPELGGLFLYGQAINNTGAPQKLLAVMGSFYDGQGQMIADASKTYAYWPSYVVPAGGSMPFELSVDEINSAAHYDLSVEAEPSTEAPRQDFEFAQVNQWTEEDVYCVEGVVHNTGSPLGEYLVVAAVLYDNQNNLVNFSDYGELGQEAGNENSSFEICVDLANQSVARHELQAWGR